MNDAELDKLIEGLSHASRNLELGQIQVHAGGGRAYVYLKDAIAPDKIMTYDDALQTAKIIEDAPMFYKNNVVGKIKSAVLSAYDGTFNILFMLDESNADYEYIDKNQAQFLALPHIDPHELVVLFAITVTILGKHLVIV